MLRRVTLKLMNVLSALFSGRSGYLASTKSLAARAEKVSKEPVSEETAENIVGMKTDRAFAAANARTIKISDNLLSSLIKDNTKE